MTSAKADENQWDGRACRNRPGWRSTVSNASDQAEHGHRPCAESGKPASRQVPPDPRRRATVCRRRANRARTGEGSACRPRAACAGRARCTSGTQRARRPCRTRSPNTPPGRCPTCSSTLGSTMPQPRISSQPVPLHMRQPSPSADDPCSRTRRSCSAGEGSVNGK